MTLNSFKCAVFFAAVYGVMWLLRLTAGKRPWYAAANKWALLLASYAFMTAADWRFSLCLLALTAVTWLCGLRIPNPNGKRWLLCGVVIMTIELTIGRKTGKSPILAMGQIGKKFKFVGWFGVLSAFIILGFYTMIMGWVLRYVVDFFQSSSASAIFTRSAEDTGSFCHIISANLDSITPSFVSLIISPPFLVYSL